jgi:hypothetical protein
MCSKYKKKTLRLTTSSTVQVVIRLSNPSAVYVIIKMDNFAFRQISPNSSLYSTKHRLSNITPYAPNRPDYPVSYHNLGPIWDAHLRTQTWVHPRANNLKLMTTFMQPTVGFCIP